MAGTPTFELGVRKDEGESLIEGVNEPVNFPAVNKKHVEIRVVHSWPFFIHFSSIFDFILDFIFIAFYSEMKLRIKKKWI